jgi:integrase
VIRRRGESWQVVVDVGRDPLTGRERRVARTVRGRRRQRRSTRAALDLEARLLVEVARGEHRVGRLSVAELLDRWLEHADLDLSPTTLHGYRSCIARQLVPRLGSVQIAELTTLHLDALHRDLRESGGANGRSLAPATVRQAHAILHRALRQAQRWGLTDHNPAVLASPPKLPRPRIDAPSAEQIARIVEAAGAHDSTLGLAVRLAAVTGARRGELCGLRWCDVDLDGASVMIRRSVINTPGQIVIKTPKTDRARRVTLDRATCDLLLEKRTIDAQRRSVPGNLLAGREYVLSEAADSSVPLDPRLLTHRFRALARGMQVDRRFHDLRHWHVTQALAAGLPVRDVAERVGHASARMTLDVYGHAITKRGPRRS